MGAATVVSGGPFGEYRVKNTRQTDAIEARLARLADQRAVLETQLPVLRNTTAQLWDEAQSARQTVNALIDDWAAGLFAEDADIPSVKDEPSDADKAEVLRLVNEIRADNGLPPVSNNAQLATAAQQHADWMAKNTVGHDGANGSKPADRVSASGYDYAMTAENVAAGQKTPAEVVKSWMNSPGHRANILNPQATELGVGGGGNGPYGRTWVQNFGAPKS